MIQHGIYLTFHNVSAEIAGKQILHNVSGYCSPGGTLAIMGASGAGKTTLLSILARKSSKKLKVSGEVSMGDKAGAGQQHGVRPKRVLQLRVLRLPERHPKRGADCAMYFVILSRDPGVHGQTEDRRSGESHSQSGRADQ